MDNKTKNRKYYLHRRINKFGGQVMHPLKSVSISLDDDARLQKYAEQLRAEFNYMVQTHIK